MTNSEFGLRLRDFRIAAIKYAQEYAKWPTRGTSKVILDGMLVKLHGIGDELELAFSKANNE